MLVGLIFAFRVESTARQGPWIATECGQIKIALTNRDSGSSRYGPKALNGNVEPGVPFSVRE